MATTRRPFSSRLPNLHQPVALSPVRPTRTSRPSAKRPRSPDPVNDEISARDDAKRVKALPPVVTRPDERKDKERRRLQREQEKKEFQLKYTRAFPSWSFHFDLDLLNPEEVATQKRLIDGILQLNGNVEDFFSNNLTHLITNKALPPPNDPTNKENIPRPKGRATSQLKSPLKSRVEKKVNVNTYDDLVLKALDFGMKVWDIKKLESVLERCLMPNSSSTATTSRTQTAQSAVTPTATTSRHLSRLLESERLRGTTTERDPTQKRHDYHYFAKGSYFLLVEDIRQELATIHALEYTISKCNEGKEIGGWPVLYCHPNARGPFVEFDEKEKKRWEKAELAENEGIKERECVKAKLKEEQRKRERMQAQTKLKGHTGDLRRTMSMNNLRRRVTHPDTSFNECTNECNEMGDKSGSVNASGYLPSIETYAAASGNSVNITSNGTTSAASNPLQSLQLPAALRERLQQQVTTSRRFSTINNAEGDQNKSKAGTMGPPIGIPERRKLKKSQSTNTLRLAKREEGCKPGYCESCRVKFEDFKEHIKGRRHKKFAMDDNNFFQLDRVLSRVQRRTRREVGCEKQLRDKRPLDQQDEDVVLLSPLEDHDEEMINLDGLDQEETPGHNCLYQEDGDLDDF